jgi:aspartate/methionine/tyrosine aminotransferase
MPLLSKRLLNTDMPLINKVGQLVQQVESTTHQRVTSLVQGMVYFAPPESCAEVLQDTLKHEKFLHQYCEHDFGMRVLREALIQKVETENKLMDHSVIVTQGANQGFSSVVNALCDPDDECVIFSPYYFNHLMALQMANVKPLIIDTKIQNKYLPEVQDFEKLQQSIDSGDNRIKMIVVTTPCNPTGTVFPKDLLEYISDFCKKNSIWLVCDETYEYFIFDESVPHHTPVGSHIIHLYSFSKAYGLMGWRVGYIVYDRNLIELQTSLHKYQDTVPISSPVPSQIMALQALKEGKQWAMKQINTLVQNREYLWEALSPYPTSVRTTGAMYYFAQFPCFANRKDVTIDEEWQVIQWLIKKYRIAVLPGSAFGYNGYFRVSYANINAEQCEQAAKRLELALRDLSLPDLDLQKFD